MSAVNVGNQDKRNLSISRGRGKRSSQHKPTAQIHNDACESKSESHSKVPDKVPSTRVSRGRGWKRPDQAIYVPKALRKDNPSINPDGRQIAEDTNKPKDKDKVCQLKKKCESIVSDSDSFLQREVSDRQSLTRQYPGEGETSVSVPSTEDRKSCDISIQKRTELPENISSESSTANNLSSNEAASLDMNEKPVDMSVMNEDCRGKKDVSEKKKVEEEEREELLRTEQDTCGKSCVDSNEKEKESKVGIESACLVDQCQVIDMYQSMSSVTSCVESDEEQRGQKLLGYQEMREGMKLEQEKPVIDSCQSSSTHESVNPDDNTKDEEEVLLQAQDMQENILKSEQQDCLTTETSSSLVIDQTIAEGEAEQEREKDFSEGNELVGIENKMEEQQTKCIEACQSSSTDTCQSSSTDTCQSLMATCQSSLTDTCQLSSTVPCQSSSTDMCQSSLTNADVNTEMHDEHDIYLPEGTHMHTTSLEQDAALCTGSGIDATTVEDCLPEATSGPVINNVLVDLKDLDTEKAQVDDKTVCFKNEVIDEQSSHTAEVAASDIIKDTSKKDEILCQNTEGQKKSQDFKITEAQGITESDQVRNTSFVDVGNEKKESIDSDDVLNNEKKNDEKECKHKKKSKKKKEEELSKEEKKKKKSKKKEREKEDEEPKEKENDEKRKLKKKEKKKASKEDSGTKSKDSKSKEKGKEKKERKCKTRNDDDDDDESWESKFNEDGECLDPEILEELTEVTGIKKPSKRKTQFDYYALPSKEVTLDDDSGYGHIVELYDFSPELKTQDLVQLLSSFKSQGYDIKWVDDTHALAVFSSEIAAKQAIQMCSSPIMKLRPVSQGTPESKNKAKNCSTFLQPYKPRPQTSKLAAHRLVTGALGVRSTMTKEEREKEREKIKEAKEQKRQEKQRKADIWGD